MRKCLADEFSDIYIFHLRGNQRTSGELSRREGGKILGSGSRAPIAVSILVKNPLAGERGRIHIHDVGDYLSREDKLAKLASFSDIAGVTKAGGWNVVVPDEHGDWLKQRDISFERFLPMGIKRSDEPKLFRNYSQGVKTNRDAWVFNFSRAQLERNVSGMAAFYNAELSRYRIAAKDADVSVEDIISSVDRKRISWADDLKSYLKRGKTLEVKPDRFVPSLYRPFTSEWLYDDKDFVWSRYQMPSIFPHSGAENRLIMIKGNWKGVGQIALMTDRIPSDPSDGGAQCFPLYLYEGVGPEIASQPGLFGEKLPLDIAYARTSGITDVGLESFHAAYSDGSISKDDVFYYVYGLLHSSEYQIAFADNLGKDLPRIPCVGTKDTFSAYVMAGKKLADLHLGYENAQKYALHINGEKADSPDIYSVQKMRYGKGGKDKTTLHYNDEITLTGIPSEAYEYIVNGKPALDWVVERQRRSLDKDSGLVNDANDWAVQTAHNPRYPLELFLRMITVSLETMTIVRQLPLLEI